MIVSPQILLGQVNSIYPNQHRIRVVSLANDFAFVGRMFRMTGDNIRYGIDNAEKSYNKKRESISDR